MNIELSGNIDAHVIQMLTALPAFEIGDRVHQIYINKLISAIPGHVSQLIGSGPSFRSVFFPQWQPIDSVADVTSYTGLDEGWWSNFSVAVLCQSMDNLTSQLRRQLLTDKISQAVQQSNQLLHQRSARFYALVLSRYFDDFKNPYNSIDRNLARQQYRQALIDNVGTHQFWYSAGQWKNPDWELFHHYAKLLALDASESDIDTLIDVLKNMGLPIPATVDKPSWRFYTAYFRNKYNIDHSDIDQQARNGILEITYVPNLSGGLSTALPEGNSYEFTANGQPGHPYRQPPGGGSCFSGNTLVLMADLSQKRIDEIQPGEMVATPSGAREVGFVSKPLLHQRTLYALNQLLFGFTASHPFLNAAATDQTASAPAFLSILPQQLNTFAPTFTHHGINRLEVGSSVLGIIQNSDPTNPQIVRVTAIDQFTDRGSDPHVYDLVFKSALDRLPQFYVGDGEQFLLVTTEMPILATVPYATMAILTALEGITVKLSDAFNIDLDVLTTQESTNQLFERLSLFGASTLTTLLNHIAHQIEPETLINAAATNLASPFALQLERYMDALGSFNVRQNVVFGAFFETLTSSLVDELELAIELGWRIFQPEAGNLLAISLGALHLDLEHKCHIPNGERLRLVIKVMNLHRTVQETQIWWSDLGRQNSPFVYYFDQVVYLNTRSQEHQITSLDFGFYLDDAPIPIYIATSYLPEQMNLFYRPFVLAVKAGDNRICGKFHYDIRLITSEIGKREQTIAPRWNNLAKERYAYLLGQNMSDFFNSHLTLAMFI